MNTRIALIAGLFLTLSLPSCKKLAELSKGGRASNTTASGSDTADDQDGALSTKLEGYIDCLNRASRDAVDSKESYLRHIDEAKGPTGKEGSVYISKLDVSSCLEAIGKAKALPPPMPDLEATVEPYRAALQALAPLVQSAYSYYDQKDYKDDNWAKGKQMHRPLMDAFAKFDQANKPFDDKVTALNEGLGARRLARLAKDPERRVEYLVANAANEAKKLVKLAEIDELSKLNAPAYEAELQTFEKAWNDLDQYIGAHKAEADKVMALSIFMSAGVDYEKSAKELLRRKRDNKDFNSENHGMPKFIDGHPAQVLSKYNAFIDRLNGMQFRN